MPRPRDAAFFLGLYRSQARNIRPNRGQARKIDARLQLPPGCGERLAQHASTPLDLQSTMPRLPRIRLDEVPLHIVQRGHNRGPCFFQDSDYRIYLHISRDAA